MTEQPKAVAMFLRPLANLLQQHGDDPAALFSEHGVSVEDTFNPEVWISVDATSALLTAAENRLQDPSLGINMARRSEYSAFGGLGLALSAGGSMLSVLQRLARYQRLISDAVQAELVVEDTTVCVQFRPSSGHVPHPQGIQYVMSSLMRLVRLRVDPALNPLEVHVAHHDEDYCASMARYFRVTPTRSDYYGLTFDRKQAAAELQCSFNQMVAMLEATLN